MMLRRRFAAAGLVVSLGLVVSGPAHAGDSGIISTGCSGVWSTPFGSQCSFPYAGPILSVAGFSTSKISSVAVKVRIIEPVTGIPLLTCNGYSSDGHSVNCVAEPGGTITPSLATLPAGAPLTCVVSGYEGGSYRCGSAAFY